MRRAILLRLLGFPVLLGLFYIFRTELLNSPLLLGRLTETTIYLVSTVRERLMIFLLAVVVVWAVRRTAKFLPGEATRICAELVVVFAVSLAVFLLLHTWHAPLKAGFLAIVMLINLVPPRVLSDAFQRRTSRNLVTGIFGVGIGFSEIFSPAPFLRWMGMLWREGRPPSATAQRLLDWIPTLLVAAMFTVALPYPWLAGLDQELFRDANVERFAGGDYRLYSPWDLTWMGLDASRERLFVCGNGTNSILVFDLRDLSRPPARSTANTGGAEFCYFNPLHKEIYVYNPESRELLWVDSNTLEPKRKVPVNFPEGETLIAWEPHQDLLTIGSEVVRPSRFGPASSMYFIERATGRVLGQVNLRVSWLLQHPSLPILYADFFAGHGRLIRYDLRRFAILNEAQADKSVDRMDFDARRNEVLVTSPVRSSVLRFDADTLQPKSPIPSLFGVRAAVIDPQRDLVLCASIATNELDVIDLSTHRSRKHFHLGPWLRDIVLDVPHGYAYVSSRGALYRVKYAD